MRDRPPIAFNKVRYHGEVVADTPVQAEQAANLVRIVYKPLPAIGSPHEALQKGAPLIHEKLGSYQKEIS